MCAPISLAYSYAGINRIRCKGSTLRCLRTLPPLRRRRLSALARRIASAGPRLPARLQSVSPVLDLRICETCGSGHGG